MEQFVAGEFQNALELDSLNESHPILQDVGNKNKISSIFDAISYNKGAAIIRMVRSYIGKDAFRAGIRLYLNTFQYGNTETYQLWEALQVLAPASNATVTDIMDTWTKQMGYPVFTVNQTADTLTQTRFFLVQPDDMDSIAASPYNYIWKAPFDFIHYSTSGNFTLTTLPLVTSQSIPFQWPSDGWIKANRDRVAFYRVNYEDSNWLAITEYLYNTDLESLILSPEDRIGLIDDAFSLSYAGQLDTTIALRLCAYLVHETEYAPWRAAISWIRRLDDLLSLTPSYKQYKENVGPLFGPVVRSLPTTRSNLSYLDSSLRSIVLIQAAHYGYDDVIRNATELFRQWRFHNISVDPGLKLLVYGMGIAEGGEPEWDYMWNKYLHSYDPAERLLYMVALSNSRQHWILSRYLNYSITQIRSQDTRSVIRYVSANSHGKHLAWNFLRRNWPHLQKRYGEQISFGGLINAVTGSFTTELELQEVEAFFTKYSDKGTASRSFRQAIEVIKGNIAWVNQYTLNVLL